MMIDQLANFDSNNRHGSSTVVLRMKRILIFRIFAKLVSEYTLQLSFCGAPQGIPHERRSTREALGKHSGEYLPITAAGLHSLLFAGILQHCRSILLGDDQVRPVIIPPRVVRHSWSSIGGTPEVAKHKDS